MRFLPRRRTMVAAALLVGLVGLLGIGVPSASASQAVISAGATAVSAGNDFDCALLEGGTAKCWGRNGHGQLGNGEEAVFTHTTTPVAVSGLSGAVAITAASEHTCAVLGDGTARCWGSGASGKLGNGMTGLFTQATPVAVSGLSNAVAISAHSQHTCAVLGDGTARCWGDGGLGKLGNGSTAESTTPVAVSGLSDTVAISAGGEHTCALLEDGGVKCWGSNVSGRLGIGASGGFSTTPVATSGLSNAVAISASGHHTCAVLAGGTAKCWGSNIDGQLGIGTKLTESNTPVSVSGLSGAVAISAGGEHTCALLGDGTARCWGWGGSGELGGEADESLTPSPVRGLTDITAISAGWRHTCAVRGGGAVICWGLHYGPLEAPANPPGTPPRPSPTPPAARITSHPSRETSDQRAVFAFTGAPGGSYECSVDAGGWRPCRSGEDFGPLVPGDHRFRVRQTVAGLTGPADSYSWTIALPRKCVLRVARARVYAAATNRARLVIRYTTYRPADVTVTYRLMGKRGPLAHGSATEGFGTAGVFRLPKSLTRTETAKLRATTSMQVRFRIPKTPGSCARYYTKRLTIPRKISGQTVWFQSDSLFAP